MDQKRIPSDVEARAGRRWRTVYGDSGRRACWTIVMIGLLGIFVSEERGLAQGPQLTVQPREMATGTRTERGGLVQVNVPSQDTVYVPQQCVGTKRCPLLVYFDAGGWGCCATWYAKTKPNIWEWWGPVAEKYGLIVLRLRKSGAGAGDVPYLDALLKEILQSFAIDPNKIAVAGRCATGQKPMTWGDNNPHVFSRMATFTANSGNPPARSPNQSAEYFLANSHVEGHNFNGVRMLREKGYPVKHLTSFRGHTHLEEDYDLLAQWLQESWAIPDPAARPKPYAFAAPGPLLTTEAMTKMTAFWTRFTQEPESLLVGGRRSHVREVIMPIGAGEISVLMTNMPALAAQYPSVAAALKAAGLTAEQHDAYRFALVSTFIGSRPYDLVRDSTSVLAKNIEFMKAHPDEFGALEKTKMWITP